MKTYIFFFAFLFALQSATAQKWKEYNPKRAIAPAACAFVSGASWGVHETVTSHPQYIPAGWNKQFWDNRISWKNKYKNGDPEQGEAFFGSTTFLVSATDARHLFASVHRTTLFATGITLTIGEKRPFVHYVADAALSAIAFSAGFHLMYSTGIVFDRPR